MKTLKITLSVWLSLLMAATGFAAIPGTLQVTAPIAPPSTSSSFGAVDARYVQGGLNTSFDNVGDWNNTAILPDGRCHLNMRVSAKNDTNRQIYRLISLSPRTFELDVDATRAAATNAVLVTPTVSGLIQSDGTANKLVVYDGSKRPIGFNGTANRVLALDGSGNPTTTSVTPTEINYSTGLNQNIQAALTALQNSRVNVGWSAPDSGDILVASGTGTAGSSGMNMAELTNFVIQTANAAAGSGGVSQVTFYAPTWVYDDPDGTINTNSPASKTLAVQNVINDASAAYNPTNGAQATIVFQPGSMHLNQLTIMPNVIYKAAGDVVIWRATDYSGLDRGIMATRRVDGVAIFNQVGVVNAFDSWKTSPVNYADPDNWYGLSDNIRFSGPGRFILKVGDKLINQPPLYLNEVRHFFVEPGAIEVWHGNTNSEHWGIAIGGRDVFWQNPIVRNGYGRGHDGVHVLNGKRMVFVGGSLETGDDSVALGRLVNGLSNIGPDEAIEDIVFIAPVCESQRGRVFFAQVGVDQMCVPWTEGNKVRRVTCVGLSGHSGIYRQAGLYFGDFAERQRIYNYRIESPGTGYPNGYSKVPVTGGGGGGAECVIRVVGGQIVGAWPSYISGASWNIGAGYTSNGTVDLSGLASGSGGAVTAIYQPYRNNLVEDIYVQGNIKVGGPSHDGTQAYGLMMEGCRRITVDCNISAVQSTSNPVHRPVNIYAAEDCKIRLGLSGSWQKSGTINPGQWPGSVVDRVTFQNGTYVGTLDSGSAVFKLTGNMGRVSFINNTFNDLRNNGYGIYTFDRETNTSPYTFITNLVIRGNDFYKLAPGTTNAYGFRLLNTTNTTAIGTLVMAGNDFTGVTDNTPGADLRSDVEHWRIYDNGGYVTENRQTATVAAGATSVVVTIGTATGFPDTSDEGIACVTPVPLGNWGSATKYWITPTSATTYTINLDAAPGGSGLKFALNENTRIRE